MAFVERPTLGGLSFETPVTYHFVHMNSVQEKSRRRVWVKRLAFSFVGLVIIVGAVELVLRQMGYTQRAAIYFDQRIGFRNWPNQTRWQLGQNMQPTVRMRINAEGFRGPLLPEEKAAGVTRVMTLGDSFSFGLGVEDDATYPVILEGVLRESIPGAEVMDVSYPGWAIANEEAAYRIIGTKFDPDWVVVGFTWDDLKFPDSGLRYSDGPFFQMFGTSAIAWAITTKWLPKLDDFGIAHPEEIGLLHKAYSEDSNLIPLNADKPMAQPYWEQSLGALEELHDQVQSDGGRLVVAYFPSGFQLGRIKKLKGEDLNADSEAYQQTHSLPGTLAIHCKSMGIDFVDCVGAFKAAKENPFDGLDAGHPGPTGIALMAREIGAHILGVELAEKEDQ